MTEAETVAAVIKGIHAALDQAATRSTPTGRQLSDDIAVLLAKAPPATIDYDALAKAIARSLLEK